MSPNRPTSLRRRSLLLAAPALLVAGCARAAQAGVLMVHKTPYCGCCGAWVARMQNAGFKTEVVNHQDLTPIRERMGVPFELSSCHTAQIDGYVVEGHVPPADVTRLLKERPKAIGLTVPGMPIGSPGMEIAGAKPEPFATLLLLDRRGRTRVFARHG